MSSKEMFKKKFGAKVTDNLKPRLAFWGSSALNDVAAEPS